MRRHTLHDWIYDIDRFFEPLADDQKLSLAGDIEETDKYILMSFDFPGMKEGDFSVKIDDNKLIIAGERKRVLKDDEKDGATHAIYGRQYGKFNKTFVLPPNLDKNAIEADYSDGVLRIVLPKSTKPEEQKIDVKVGSQKGFFERLNGSK